MRDLCVNVSLIYRIYLFIKTVYLNSCLSSLKLINGIDLKIVHVNVADIPIYYRNLIFLTQKHIDN